MINNESGSGKDVTISNCTFQGNEAVNDAGAIQYKFKRPIMTDIIHIDNQASYGPDVGSYPNKVRIVDASYNYLPNVLLEEVVSGQLYENELYV